MSAATVAYPIALDSDVIARSFGWTTARDLEARLACLRHLHQYYLRYIADPALFQDIPRLNGDPLVTQIETAWLQELDHQVADEPMPDGAAEFPDWFVAISSEHAQPEFCSYLAEEASAPEIALLIVAEELVDGRFDDLVAMVQTGTTGRAKMVIADNYWDEMGRGESSKVHTTMFAHSSDYMRKRLLEGGGGADDLDIAETYGNAALLLMYGIYRHLAPRALGAMGVMEESASPRFAAMVRGCERLAIPEDIIAYQRVHIDMDAAHGRAWFQHVLLPMAQSSPEALHEICMGVRTRIVVAEAYYRQVAARMQEVRLRAA